jgi:acyl-phosphate glycerol 3-phosphate acyltransferase
MNGPALACLAILAAYLIGAIPFGYLVARWRGVDIFKEGSGNIGATNIGRILGRRFGILVFLLDFAKGALPVLAATAIAQHLSLDWPADLLPVGAGLAAFLGHLFPVYLGFRGGKGVATGAGVVAMLLPGPALAAVLVWVAVLCATRYVSLASLSAAAALCGLRLWLTAAAGPFAEPQRILTLFCFLAVGLVFLRHRANLTRLLHGNENRLRDSPAMLLLTKTIHVLALGLWFGSITFFMLGAFVIFHAYESLAAKPANERPPWVPLPEDFDKEKGTKLAGVAVAPLFDWYFPLEGVCGLLTVATAMAWSGSKTARTVHKVRAVVLTAALVSVLIDWPLTRYVGQLSAERYASVAAIAANAQAAFASWHNVSLGVKLITFALVAVAMALAAQLPSEDRQPLAP